MDTPSTYIANSEHYSIVLDKVQKVRKVLWIGTADIKDLYVKQGTASFPFLKVLSNLIQRGVEIRLIHAKEPGPNFRKDFDKYPALASGLERVLCPRVHFKLMIFDLETVYIGSANLTGAGIGMKGDDTRNFEAGILTSDPALVEATINQFDTVWMGSFCSKCKRKTFCGDRIK
ncbi:phosphatidylserine/phosphatidylglycerophosphate/cardiolipin synthase-like enzyme [Parabacteroides sp. PF5-5]|uniref:phospholipase D-like domain-containing protein n=1 Tax=unclassified Parabacteroides TaxID=2649774 RepID=UPI002475678F|nr:MULTISPECIES: phospholipase D-like domain-containing protein [unclassified Parabacteroides]MDH6305842.1 phosphatidylserine/phosphatidylglycerophosphate/cardiolipin synthase-like enzyme [Parabacteroides sp. PH5-39]MDH6317344.1 phosphatidylserine/phosphatidylglycerophosphate/cardiolipin synthase-like enzyme [Parabacteroides sp. PF5-13]MDH6320552.1 phosphatidylserine/phosphatidylglycerophosphate/cardiolipin synthase-like enzyme [Parabacteroides sp. PH5-13]MDH6324285.1 phosphatidylserine/phospha